jgi:hypothetical protein
MERRRNTLRGGHRQRRDAEKKNPRAQSGVTVPQGEAWRKDAWARGVGSMEGVKNEVDEGKGERWLG